MTRKTAVFALLPALALGCGAGAANRTKSAGAPAPPRVTPGSLDARPLLGDLPARAEKLGAGPPAVVAQGQIVEGERMGAFVEVPANACLLAYARGSVSLEDLDVAAFSDEGNPVSVDEGPDPKPTLLVCPPHPDRMYVAVHAAGGEGLVVLGAQLVPKDRAVEIERTLGARGALGGTPRRPESWPGLDDLSKQRRTQLGGTWEDVRRVALAVDSKLPSFVGFPMEAEQCTDALVVPDDDVALVDIEVADGEGRVLARAREGVAGPRGMTICSSHTLSATLSVRPHVGRGLVAVVVGRTKGERAKDLVSADVLWLAATQPLDKRKKDRAAFLEKSGYTAPTKNWGAQLAIGRRWSASMDGAGTGCQRFDLTAGQPAAWLQLRASDDRGTLIAEAEGSQDAALYTCGSTKLRLEVEARGHPGPFALEARKESWADAAFAAQPLAASRLLSRLAAASPTGLLDGTAGTVKQASLSASQSISWDEVIPQGRCVRLGVGSDGEGTGIEAQILDATTQEELDRSHAARSAVLRACAPAGAARTVHAEIRVTSGKLAVVAAIRVL